MNNFNNLLDELNKRIILTEEQILHSEKTRNSILKITNILNLYNIKLDSLSIKNIHKVPINDLELLQKEINYIDDNFTEKANNFIDLYSLSKNDQSILKNNQYKKMNEFMLDFIMFLKNYVFKYNDYKNKHLKSLKDILNNYKVIYNKFEDGVLKEPILDMLEFHDVLNKCGFDLETKIKLKKDVGKANYNLIFQTKKKENQFHKYEVIISKNKNILSDKYKEIITYIMNHDIKMDSNNITTEVKKVYDDNSFSFNEVKVSLSIYLMEKLIRYNKNYEETVTLLEKVLLVMKKDKKDFGINSNISKTKAEELKKMIKPYEEILKQNAKVLNKYKVDENQRFDYLKEISIKSDDFNDKFALILESMRLKIKESSEFSTITEKKFNENLKELKDYKKAYDILKKRV